MPKYDYQCEKCEDVQEFEHSMRETPEFICENCKCPRVRLISSKTSFQLKGGGWFKDGYSSTTKG